MSFPLFIARRINGQTDDRKKVSRPAIRIATAGVAIGLAVMIVTVAVVLGFKHTIRDKVVGFGSHIQVINVRSIGSSIGLPVEMNDSLMQQLKAIPGVRHVERYAMTQGILKTDEDFLGVMFKGIGPEYDTSFLKDCIVEGQLPAFHDTNPLQGIESGNSAEHPYELVISKTMAQKLKLKVGNLIYAYFINNQGNNAKPVSRLAFRVSAVYQTNMKRFDDTFCIADLFVTARRNGWKGKLCSGAELLVDDFNKLEQTDQNVIDAFLRKGRLDSQGNTLTSVTIHQLYPTVFQWLDLLDINVWIILALMVALAGFTMISGLLIIILERTQMIGVLKALGARNATIRRTFLWFSVFIIGRGLLWGNIIGIGIILLQKATGIVSLDPQTYYVSEAPMELNLLLILLLNIATLLISVFVLVGPSYLVSRIHPARSMRFATLLAFVPIMVFGQKPVESRQDIESLCRQIDEAIAESPHYVAQREAKISAARHAYNQAGGRQKYEEAFRLYELYRPFISDSAIYFLQECISLAEQQADHAASVRCHSLLAIRCSNIGLYDEALNILDSIRIEASPTGGGWEEALGTYYEAYNNVYGELSYYTRLDDMRQRYQAEEQRYRQLMFSCLPPTSEACLMRREQAAQAEGRLEESMAINDEWMQTVEPGSHPYALAALYRYIEFKLQRDTTQMMYWLTESVLADIRNAAMDQGSMWELANELMLSGDIERASRYISYTSDCANRYGSRQRNWQITPLLTHIANEYKEQSERTTTQLRLALVAASLLALLLLAALFFVHRRNKQLHTARNALSASNAQLSTLNAQLSTQKDELAALNIQLSMVNGQLSIVNGQLTESNRVKEEYIGRFMSLCAQYIDKLDNYRKMVNKKMKNKELDELFQMSKSTELKERELDELYENFDTVFLHLFPNFIDDFNALLQPEMQIHPKQENRLTTDIRIFALIRLGFEDSSKIAEFLHYSVNTIYNYRARIKNGALGNREQFEKQVKEL